MTDLNKIESTLDTIKEHTLANSGEIKSISSAVSRIEGAFALHRESQANKHRAIDDDIEEVKEWQARHNGEVKGAERARSAAWQEKSRRWEGIIRWGKIAALLGAGGGGLKLIMILISYLF